ncbi:hypothetical protein BWI96_10880 [Siphonobacter sp. SORGH_AS_0500]|uniref:biliverdin-producing heme oxygenase n=1 Tax=Siphonobacter sp. SORGH_AS_0500 TaxID=1864824 RepID=UPI000CB678A7|nr:biliverdin-producing heme oxygenase [Siphonobacter sp. SORGH_AS_0500]PKK36365.1 hypothetical protein BWI96_10880 [Siphonobacter sp. SORGH_AS_0500]
MGEILSQLKEQTRELHEQTEQLFYTDALKGGTLTTDQYKHLLQAHLAFHKALEVALSTIDNYPLEERRKAAWIEADLTAIQASPKTAPSTVFEGWNTSELLGAAYVAEGSMLGGQVIKRWLQAHPELGTYAGESKFYNGYGKNTGERWKSFGTYLVTNAAGHEPAIVEGAKKAFKAYQAIFKAVA